MTKYDFEFKMKLVKEYLNGTSGFRKLQSKHGIQGQLIRQWVRNYRHFGEEGLKNIKKPRTYPFEFKLYVVQLYLTGNISYMNLAPKVGMTNPGLITKWVNDFKAAGPAALKPRKGHKLKMSKKEIKKTIKNGSSEDHKKLLEQLQEENLKLRIENAFLKEMRRLNLEEKALQKKQRESSTASEKNSD